VWPRSFQRGAPPDREEETSGGRDHHDLNRPGGALAPAVRLCTLRTNRELSKNCAGIGSPVSCPDQIWGRYPPTPRWGCSANRQRCKLNGLRFFVRSRFRSRHVLRWGLCLSSRGSLPDRAYNVEGFGELGEAISAGFEVLPSKRRTLVRCSRCNIQRYRRYIRPMSCEHALIISLLTTAIFGTSAWAGAHRARRRIILGRNRSSRVSLAITTEAESVDA